TVSHMWACPALTAWRADLAGQMAALLPLDRRLRASASRRQQPFTLLQLLWPSSTRSQHVRWLLGGWERAEWRECMGALRIKTSLWAPLLQSLRCRLLTRIGQLWWQWVCRQ